MAHIISRFFSPCGAMDERLMRGQTATTMTMNSPDALTELFHLATSGAKDKAHAVKTAELMREVGLKCIGFNGVCIPLSFRV